MGIGGVFLVAALYYGMRSRWAAPLKSQPSDPRAKFGSQVFWLLMLFLLSFVLITNT